MRLSLEVWNHFSCMSCKSCLSSICFLKHIWENYVQDYIFNRVHEYFSRGSYHLKKDRIAETRFDLHPLNRYHSIYQWFIGKYKGYIRDILKSRNSTTGNNKPRFTKIKSYWMQSVVCDRSSCSHTTLLQRPVPWARVLKRL